MLSQEDASYLSGLFEKAGLSIHYRKDNKPPQVDLRFGGTPEQKQIICSMIGDTGYAERSSPRTVQITCCNTKRKDIIRDPLRRIRWRKKPILRELLPQLKFKTETMESKRLEAIAALEYVGRNRRKY
jgi:hypothetical protein